MDGFVHGQLGRRPASLCGEAKGVGERSTLRVAAAATARRLLPPPSRCGTDDGCDPGRPLDRGQTAIKNGTAPPDRSGGAVRQVAFDDGRRPIAAGQAVRRARPGRRPAGQNGGATVIVVAVLSASTYR